MGAFMYKAHDWFHFVQKDGTVVHGNINDLGVTIVCLCSYRFFQVMYWMYTLFFSKNATTQTMDRVRLARRIVCFTLMGVVFYLVYKNGAFDKVNVILKLWLITELVTSGIEFILIELFESRLRKSAESQR